MRSRSFSGLALVALSLPAAFVTLAVACGDDPELVVNTGGAGGGVGGGEAGHTSAQGGDGGLLLTTGPGSGGSVSDGGGGACAGDLTEAELLPLDMYLMLDRSLSMEEETDTPGVTKWEAIKSALSSFAVDSQSVGIGVGLQYFPANAPCSSDAACGGSYCYLDACNNTATPAPCQGDADCPGQVAGSCVPLGQCGAATCTAIGGTCPNMLPCVAVTDSVCVTADSCAVTNFSTPDVAIGELPGSEAALSASLASRDPAPIPYGFTATGPALHGAIDYAQTWATANPTHRTIVVLATDGSPTQCAPTGSAAVAAIAATGFHTAPSVTTFTIGVFAPGDTTGPANIEAIADSGGGQAFVVDAMGDVAQDFIDALNAIRTEALECEFDIPDPPSGQEVDYDKVNVELDGETIPYVGSEGACDPVTGGWYYDAPPSSGPETILLCDASCDELQQTIGASVSIRVGCDTFVPR
jgi:hypothetical protein